MTCNFRVGQKVVAIKGHGIDSGQCIATPIYAGSVFTIRAIQVAKRSSGLLQTGLLFDEIRNEVLNTKIGLFERDYDARCFRPVSESKTDISIFKSMLNPSKAKVQA